MIIHRELSRSTHYVTDSGEIVKWTFMTKHLYAHMLNRNWFFKVIRNGNHYESQKRIAEDIASDYQVVGRCLRAFRSHGLIDFTTESIPGSVQKRCVYQKMEGVLNLMGPDQIVKRVNLLEKIDTGFNSGMIDDIENYFEMIGD